MVALAAAGVKVTKATCVRVNNGKTLQLMGVPSNYSVENLAPLIPFPVWRIFPLDRLRGDFSSRSVNRFNQTQ